ncbi:MAG: NADP-dependent malic enzyme [Bacteroidia bacterium]|nr:NADP-dependent malic enzyme [Bacteroidia bacterium]
MSDSKLQQDALNYHSEGRPGKIEVIPTKPYSTKRDLSLAYSPGVAEPCIRIAENTEDVYKYTAKGNLVAVISNGTAVLGLGNIGAEASKPVMEGKGLLFKIFADIDVFDIELNVNSIDEFVNCVKAMEPTFGGINLEDIKSPECFEIERRLRKELNIPIMHDDQHGTAIISGAGLLNALKIVNKDIDKVRMVVNGAGASAISCSKLFVSLGVNKENLIMLDSKGVIRKDRSDLDENKLYFATDQNFNHLEDALVGADVFVGLSKGNILTPEMVLSMAKDPIVFALANPEPEIDYELAVNTRADIVMATGRSDYPNQVNNVLGFPFIFRGALDVRATEINEEMKLAAVRALAALTLEPVPEAVSIAYKQEGLSFGRNYIIPKPLDPRLIEVVAPAVAQAAMDSGVAKRPITNMERYKQELRDRLGLDNKFMRRVNSMARKNPKTVVFVEADNFKILKAAQISLEEGIARPILLGDKVKINSLIEEYKLDLQGVQMIDPWEESAKRSQYGEILYAKRQRKGLTLNEAKKLMKDRNYYGMMMLETGAADAVISGLTKNYSNTIRPALQVIGKEEGYSQVSGMYIMMTKKGPFFFADTTVNINPNWEELVEITRQVHKKVLDFGIEPKIAMLSYSNFGSSNGEIPSKMQKAVAYLHKNHPEINVDGEMQATFALNRELLSENFPFSTLANKEVNTFIFPELASGNIAYNFAKSFGKAETMGPILMGLKRSVHILQLASSVREIVNMVAVAVIDAQGKSGATSQVVSRSAGE